MHHLYLNMFVGTSINEHDVWCATPGTWTQHHPREIPGNPFRVVVPSRAAWAAYISALRRTTFISLIAELVQDTYSYRPFGRISYSYTTQPRSSLADTLSLSLQLHQHGFTKAQHNRRHRCGPRHFRGVHQHIERPAAEGIDEQQHRPGRRRDARPQQCQSERLPSDVLVQIRKERRRIHVQESTGLLHVPRILRHFGIREAPDPEPDVHR